jgi:integrase/recombinase XerD
MKPKQDTVVEKAMIVVPGFKEAYKKLEQKITLSNQSKSTLTNYSRKIANVCLHFKALPEQVEDDEIDEYLATLARSSKTPSRSSFKHTVYGLRFYFRLLGLTKRAIALPQIKHNDKLPVVLSKEECRRLFAAPHLLKHRIILAFIYSSGLRSNEISNLKISDVDSSRMMIHVRQGKGKKDRYVPLSKNIIVGLRKYYQSCKPVVYLFNGQEIGKPISNKGLGWIMNQAKKKANITKDASIHTLRHSYATHLLEDGLDIVTIKGLLGHEKIETTMVYLHIAKPNAKNAFSPFDTLYKLK